MNGDCGTSDRSGLSRKLIGNGLKDNVLIGEWSGVQIEFQSIVSTSNVGKSVVFVLVPTILTLVKAAIGDQIAACHGALAFVDFVPGKMDSEGSLGNTHNLFRTPMHTS